MHTVTEKRLRYLLGCLSLNRNIVLNLPLVFQAYVSRPDRDAGSFLPISSGGMRVMTLAKERAVYKPN